MGRKRTRKKGAAGVVGRAALWAVILVSVLAIGFVGGYLYRERPHRALPKKPARSNALAELESVLGNLSEPTRVRVADRATAEAVLERVRAISDRSGASAALTDVNLTGSAIHGTLKIGPRAYGLELEWPPSPEPPPVPRLAIIIDDMGRDVEQARALLDLPIPITLSILPHLAHSQKIAMLAQERGREFLLHLPMQPQGYPTVDPGAGALLEGMGEKDFLRVISEDLKDVPGAVGVNNHMGSRLTEQEAPMRWLMHELEKRRLYFVDSVTTARTVGVPIAVEAGVDWGRRDVFLDNVQEANAVGEQMQKAVHLSQQAGRAIAIGHPHKATLNALQVWTSKIKEAGVRVVPPSEILQKGSGA